MPKRKPEKILVDVESTKERVRWAINFVITAYNLSNEKLAKELGFNTSAINTYRVKKTLPGLDFFVPFIYKYSFNIEWFLHGTGEPFPGARARYPEVCGPEQPSTLYNKDTASPDHSPPGIDPALQAMSDIKDIFASGDPVLVPAIQANIVAFKRALQREHQFAQLIEENRELRERIANLEAQVDDLRRQIDRLTAPPITAAQQEAF